MQVASTAGQDEGAVAVSDAATAAGGGVFYRGLLPQMQQIVRDTLNAAASRIGPGDSCPRPAAAAGEGEPVSGGLRSFQLFGSVVNAQCRVRVKSSAA